MNDTPLAVAPLQLPFNVQLTLPGSKSHANRAIVAACLSDGTTVIHNATPCDDVRVMVENLQVLGFDISWTDKDAGDLRIVGGIPNKQDAWGELFCENAGTTLRFLCSVAALVPGQWTVTGNEHMCRRPIGDLVAALRELGAEISDVGGKPPVTITGGTLRGGTVKVDASKSSQFLSSLLLIAPCLPKGLNVSVVSTLASPGYVELTTRVMRDFGVTAENKDGTFIVKHGAYAAVPSYAIEGDWSAAGVWLVLKKISGGRVVFTNLHDDSSQSDRVLPKALEALMRPGNVTVDCTDFPDQVMNLALFGAFRTGNLQIIGAKNLRFKECDRLAVITTELTKAGISIRQHDDGVTVQGMGEKRHLSHTPVILDPHDDHRMAMVFAALGLIRGGVSIVNPECVAKSYPNFFTHLELVSKSHKPIAIVGMRGSGKTNLAKRLSKVLHLPQIDTDQVIEERIGTLDVYVEQNGWPAFREIEEEVVAQSLLPGHIISLGGGACESAATRALLKEHAVVLWLHATVESTVERLKNVKRKRPSLTPDLSLEQEVETVLKRRDPQYKEVATIELSHRVPFPAQVPRVLGRLKRLPTSYDLHGAKFISAAEQHAPPPRRRRK